MLKIDSIATLTVTVVAMSAVSLGGGTARADGVPKVIVPNVVGKPHGAAISLLRSRGLEFHKDDKDPKQHTHVQKQSPVAGTPVSFDEVIALTLYAPQPGAPKRRRGSPARTGRRLREKWRAALDQMRSQAKPKHR